MNNTGLFGLSNEIAISLLLTLMVILLVVANSLHQTRKRLVKMRGEATGEVQKESRWSKFLDWYHNRLNKRIFFGFMSTVIVVLLCFGMYHRAQDIGTQIGYAPEQPIRFNHKLHAGQYGVDCKYCHQGVEKGKQAGIPSISTCMNCHAIIKQGPQYGPREIAKVVSAWETKKPVKWVRIHNLPDHVYFNHAQHVVAGKLACENCHGEVAAMEKVQQVSTLEMGWCINCHREKNVDSKNNDYYKKTFDFVNQHQTYTVAQMGGLECNKCHY